MTKTKEIRMPGKERPLCRNLGSRGLPRRCTTFGMLAETRNPPTAGPQAKLQRVSIADSCGTSPVSSALDHSARRDPSEAVSTHMRSQPLNIANTTSPCSDTLRRGKTITSSANLYGRF
jgi:hypothetical protein